jgi:hypothetical protein
MEEMGSQYKNHQVPFMNSPLTIVGEIDRSSQGEIVIHVSQNNHLTSYPFMDPISPGCISDHQQIGPRNTFHTSRSSNHDKGADQQGQPSPF